MVTITQFFNTLDFNQDFNTLVAVERSLYLSDF